MALTLENPLLVWQRARIALETLEAKKSHFHGLKELKEALATISSNPNLQFVAIADLGADAIIADAACKVYAIYLRKRNTSTAAFFKADDHASSAGTTASNMVHELNAAKQHVLITYPQGYAQTVGFTVGSDTTADGSTASTSGDGPDGFVVIGAA